MRTDATFVTIPYSRLTNNNMPPLQYAGGVNILIDSSDFDFSVIIKYAQTHQYKLIYSLSEAIIQNNLFSRIYLLHTLCDFFIKDKGSIPVFSAGATDNALLGSLKSYFEQQGEQIDFTYFDLNSREAQLKNTLLYIPAELAATGNKTNTETFANQDINLVLIDHQFAVKDNPWLYNLFYNAAATKKAGWESYKSKLWQERAKLYLSFIALGKKVGEAEYYDLRQWYHNEYEVLPLWFKRLGHIVKVVTGKRSLKSLFPGRIKKNK